MPRRPDEIAWDDDILADFHEHAGKITGAVSRAPACC